MRQQRHPAIMKLTFLVLFFCSLLPAQVNTATILGAVTDASGGAVPGASLTVTNRATELTQTATADAAGSYSFERLPVGDYSLVVKAAGFKQFERPDIHVDATQRVKIDVVMEVGVVSESVTVSGGASLVSTQNTELGVVIGEQQVRNLPLNGRNFAQLIALEPGAVVSGGAVYFNGLSRDNMNITVDGTDAANPDRPATSDFGGQTQQNILSVEFIQEFKTSKGVFSAELGRASSGGVNVITKSGTNEFHGTTYEFIRNDALDARNFFAASKDELRLNQFGANAGGPVLRNRLFFFLGWEGVRERRGTQITGTVPTDSLRQRMLAANPAYAQILNLMPPSNEDRGDPDRGFHRRSAVRTNREDSAIARLDLNPTAKDNVFARYSILSAYTVVPGLSPINGTEYPTQDRTGTFSWNRILSAKMVNEFRAGVNKQDIPRANQAFIPQQIGSLSGFLSTPNQEVLRANGGSWTILDNFGYTAGRHSLRAGFEVRKFHYGRANYQNPTYTMETLADILASRFTDANVVLGNDLRRLGETQTGIYIQDDFRASSRLTLNLGLRYEYFTPVSERDGLSIQHRQRPVRTVPQTGRADLGPGQEQLRTTLWTRMGHGGRQQECHPRRRGRVLFTEYLPRSDGAGEPSRQALHTADLRPRLPEPAISDQRLHPRSAGVSRDWRRATSSIRCSAPRTAFSGASTTSESLRAIWWLRSATLATTG